MSFIRSARSYRQIGQTALDNDALRALAPSIFADDKHESRSERYAYIPTAQVVDGMRDQGFAPVFAKQGGSRIEGKAEFTKHLIRFRRMDEVEAGRRIGGLYPEVVIVNSHDGTSAYKVMAGLMRMVCLNGLLVCDQELASVTVRHKGDVASQVIEGSFQVLEDSRRALDVAEEWSGIKLSHDEQKVMAEAAHLIRFGDSEGNITTPIKADAMLRPRRREDFREDLWTVGNVIQENAIRGGLTGRGRDANNRPRKATSREVKGIDADVKINRALWLLNERMAQLKG